MRIKKEKINNFRKNGEKKKQPLALCGFSALSLDAI